MRDDEVSAAGNGGEGVAADGTERLIGSDKVEGTPAYNRRAERLRSASTS